MLQHGNFLLSAFCGHFNSVHVLFTHAPPSPLLLTESMILLGSIERAQLQSLMSRQLGRARRLEFIRDRSVSEKKSLSVLTVPSKNDDNQRASQEVRFQVRGHSKQGRSISLHL